MEILTEARRRNEAVAVRMAADAAALERDRRTVWESALVGCKVEVSDIEAHSSSQLQLVSTAAGTTITDPLSAQENTLELEECEKENGNTDIDIDIDIDARCDPRRTSEESFNKRRSELHRRLQEFREKCMETQNTLTQQDKFLFSKEGVQS